MDYISYGQPSHHARIHTHQPSTISYNRKGWTSKCFEKFIFSLVDFTCSKWPSVHNQRMHAVPPRTMPRFGSVISTEIHQIGSVLTYILLRQREPKAPFQHYLHVAQKKTTKTKCSLNCVSSENEHTQNKRLCAGHSIYQMGRVNIISKVRLNGKQLHSILRLWLWVNIGNGKSKSIEIICFRLKLKINNYRAVDWIIISDAKSIASANEKLLEKTD